MLQILIVWIDGARRIYLLKTEINDSFSDDRTFRLNQMNVLLCIFGFCSLVAAVLNFFGREYFRESANVYIPAVVMGILLYELGYLATQFDVSFYTRIHQSHAIAHVPSNYVISDEKDISTETLKEAVEQAMDQQQLFRTPNLNIYQLAAAVNSNRTYVSNLINSVYHVNFATFVAGYRVKHAKQVLASNEFQTDKEAISTAIDTCGFSSEQTFYRIFKQHTGMTPTQYRKNNLQ